MPISVYKRIRIKQTQKTKALYPTLVIFKNNEVITFYPQARADKSISIIGFLRELKTKNIVCLDEGAIEILKLLLKDMEFSESIRNLIPKLSIKDFINLKNK